MAYTMETWNMAEQTLQRLSRILDLCVETSFRRDYDAHLKCLLELKKNLAAFLNDTEIEELENKFNELPEGWWNQTMRCVNPVHFAKVNKIFDEIYMFCVRRMKKKGLLMPEAKDAGRAVARMS